MEFWLSDWLHFPCSCWLKRKPSLRRTPSRGTTPREKRARMKLRYDALDSRVAPLHSGGQEWEERGVEGVQGVGSYRMEYSWLEILEYFWVGWSWKPLPYFRPKNTIFHTLFQTWLSKCIPYFRPCDVWQFRQLSINLRRTPDFVRSQTMRFRWCKRFTRVFFFLMRLALRTGHFSDTRAGRVAGQAGR